MLRDVIDCSFHAGGRDRLLDAVWRYRKLYKTLLVLGPSLFFAWYFIHTLYFEIPLPHDGDKTKAAIDIETTQLRNFLSGTLKLSFKDIGSELCLINNNKLFIGNIPVNSQPGIYPTTGGMSILINDKQVLYAVKGGQDCVPVNREDLLAAEFSAEYALALPTAEELHSVFGPDIREFTSRAESGSSRLFLRVSGFYKFLIIFVTLLGWSAIVLFGKNVFEFVRT
jgi:hypothetical protein